jgi:carboxyl-terminal processing protease
VLTTPDGRRVGYILLISFADETIDDQVGDALEAMAADGPLDGLVLDNRYNGGGADVVANGTLRYFIDGLTGHFVSRVEERPFRVEGVNVAGSQEIPMVVLVGSGTVSFGEIFSGILKDFGRAFLIGETTDGNVELLWGYDFEDGSRAWIAHDYFRPTNNPEANWEENGIQPDQTVASQWHQVTIETDPAVLAALEHFDSQ